MAGRRLAAIILSEAEREELTSLTRRGRTAQAIAMRARIILSCAAGQLNKDVAAGLRVFIRMTVGKQAGRFSAAPCGRLARPTPPRCTSHD